MKDLEKIYYVYVQTDEDGIPYYVGCGKGNRIENNHAHHIGQRTLKKLEENLTKSESLIAERKWIQFYGRKDINTGTLLNKVDGSIGPFNLSDKNRKIRSALSKRKFKMDLVIASFERELKLINRSDETIKGYISSLKAFLKYFTRNPKTITTNEIKDYLVTLPVFTRKTAIAAIKSFYKHCITGNKLKKLEYPKLPEYVPDILSKEEVYALISAASNIKHRTIIMLLYSTAMRVSEVINLKWIHIDRTNSCIKVSQGKGKKDRIVPLTERMIKQLELYCITYQNCNSKNYVFEGAKLLKYSKRSIAQFLVKYADKANIKKKVTPHLLRHCAGTHWRDAGVDLADIQDIMGHKHPNTTRIYSKLTNLKNVTDLL